MVGELDTFAETDIDYYDPDEDQEIDNPETEVEAPVGEENEPTQEVEAEDNQDDDPENQEEPDDDPLIELDGEEVKLSELKADRMRQQDYSRKTAEIARERETVQQTRQFFSQRQTQLDSLLQETMGFLESVIPEEPPLSLAQTNPQEFQYQKELRQRAKAEIDQLVEKSKQAKETGQQVQQFTNRQTLMQHVDGLERRFPHLKGEQSKLVAFIKDTRDKAADFGFSQQELAQVTDDRLLEMAHYAALGKKAEHNRNNAKRRMQNPKKGNARPATAKGNTGNRKAMQRLEQSGSLRDAIHVDFD